jgi:integrase
MASLRKHPKSPFWFACFTLPDGRRTNRSTGTSEKRKALTIALKYEDAAREAVTGRFVESRARKAIADIYAIANTDNLPGSTVQGFMDAWLKRKEIESDERTFERYSGVVQQFIDHLGSKKNRDIVQITPAEVTSFRDDAAQRLAPGTVNLMVKIIRVALAQARRDGLIESNPAERVSLLKRTKDGQRRPFTLPELRRILEVAGEEWKGMILVGLYTGQRLGDIAALTWQNVDLQRGELRFVTDKTGRRQIIPLAAPLQHYIEALPAGDKPAAPLFPRAFDVLEKQGRAGSLSNQFHKILTSAGLAEKKSHHTNGNGRAAKRERNEVSFHSLRHTATSLLKSAGVSDAVAMEFVGHDSKSVSQQYTHIETSALKLAADKMPDITAIAGPGSTKNP